MRTTMFLRSGNFDLTDIIGSGDSFNPGVLTPWSVQSSMISNFERILTGLRAGASKGRILAGGDMQINGSIDSVTISPMVAVTKGNKVIWTQKPLTLNVSGAASSYEIWAKFSMKAVPDTASYGKVARPAGTYIFNDTQLVTDELAAGNPDVDASDVFQVGEPTEDSVYIGELLTTPSAHAVINPDRGYPITDTSGYQVISKILVDQLIATDFDVENIAISGILTAQAGGVSNFLGNVNLSSNVDFASGSQVKIAGSNAYTGVFTFTEDGGGAKSVTFVNGICTQVS